MEIKRIVIDNVNEIIAMTVVHMDYKGQVAKRINEKMPLATVKGFRKGQVPKDLVAKQYGKAIKQEEVKKVVDLALERYIQSERLYLLGSPIPKENESLDWNAEEIIFEFEIGLMPEFELNLEAENNLTKYIVKADDEMINDQIKRIQKQYGIPVNQEVVTENCDVTGTFTNQEFEINNNTIISFDAFKNATTTDLFIGKKVGDVVTLATKDLFKDDHQLMDYLKIGHDEVHGLEIDVDFTITGINTVTLADLNQELYDKLFGEGIVTTNEELKQKIKESFEIQFAQQAAYMLKTDVQEAIISNTKFDLPEEFLIKWMQATGDKSKGRAEARVEYLRTERGLRYQIIEGKALAENDVKVTFEDLKNYTSNAIRQQMAQYGQANPSQAEIDGIVAKVLTDKKQVEELSREAAKTKLIDLMIEKAKPTEKEVTYKEFVAAMYGE